MEMKSLTPKAPESELLTQPTVEKKHISTLNSFIDQRMVVTRLSLEASLTQVSLQIYHIELVLLAAAVPARAVPAQANSLRCAERPPMCILVTTKILLSIKSTVTPIHHLMMQVILRLLMPRQNR